jgi:hypothetical protein
MPINTDRAESLPGHLGTALSGAGVPDKGLPQADRREPLAGAAGADSHLAGGQAGDPLPGNLPSGEDILSASQQEEIAIQNAMYGGQISPSDCMARIYHLRTDRVRILEEMNHHEQAEQLRDRLKREMAA